MNIENVAAYQGAYSGATTYDEGDIVSYSGATYLSLINSNTGNQPDTNPTDWVVLGNTVANTQTFYEYETNGSTASLSLPAGRYLIDVTVHNAGTPISSLGMSGASSNPVPFVAPTGGFQQISARGVFTLSSPGTLTLVVNGSGNADECIMTAVPF